MIVVGVFLVTCSEDRTICIWNTKTLKLVQTVGFDEAILRVIEYKYKVPGIKVSGEHLIKTILVLSTVKGVMYTIDLDSYTGKENFNPKYKLFHIISYYSILI